MKKKSKPGPKQKVPKTNRSMSFETELLEAAEKHAEKHPMKPSLPTIMNLALRRYLEQEGEIQKHS